MRFMTKKTSNSNTRTQQEGQNDELTPRSH